MAKAKGLMEVLKRLGPKKVQEMDEAAKKGMFGQPEKAAKKEKDVKLSKKEQEEMQKSLDEKEKKKPRAKKRMTADERVKEAIRKGGMEDPEYYRKGGMVKKYAAGGMAKCGASNPPSGGARK
jgi:hypothetical protein